MNYQNLNNDEKTPNNSCHVYSCKINSVGLLLATIGGSISLEPDPALVGFACTLGLVGFAAGMIGTHLPANNEVSPKDKKTITSISLLLSAGTFGISVATLGVVPAIAFGGLVTAAVSTIGTYARYLRPVPAAAPGPAAV